MISKYSDLSSFSNRMDQISSMHNKNTSTSETNTTGLSLSASDCERSAQMTSPTSTESPTFFAAPSLRHSNTSTRRQPINDQRKQIYTLNSSHLLNCEGLQSEQDTKAMQLSSQRLMSAASNSILPAYSNMNDDNTVPDALDEFIRQREVHQPLENSGQITAFYRSQSSRTQTADQALYLLKNDLNQFYQPQTINSGPPVYPRTHQSTALYRSLMDNNRPTIVARSSHRHLLASNTGTQPYPQLNNRFSMPSYHQALGMNEVPISNVGYMDTIDSHLNRLTNTVVNGHYLNQNTAYANALQSNSYTQEMYNNQNQSVEHIYDVNAYATPEQTPQRRPDSISQAQPATSERPCVSQLIQTFNSRAPDQ